MTYPSRFEKGQRVDMEETNPSIEEKVDDDVVPMEEISGASNQNLDEEKAKNGEL